jgi:hypothetical protein
MAERVDVRADRPRRLVLLGASNVTLGLRPAVRAAWERFGVPLDVFVACGHGRSYGVDGNVFGRVLPPISTCGLWRRLESEPREQTVAIVTDLGNDICFGFTPAQLEGWVASCLDRLAQLEARVVISAIPLASLRCVSRAKFLFFSRLFFPGRGLDQGRALAAGEELYQRIERLARERGVVLVEQMSSWYGLDPIHVKRSARAECWRAYVGALPGAGSTATLPFDAPWRQRGRLVAQERRILGFDAGLAQPCARLANGTALHLF